MNSKQRRKSRRANRHPFLGIARPGFTGKTFGIPVCYGFSASQSYVPPALTPEFVDSVIRKYLFRPV